MGVPLKTGGLFARSLVMGLALIAASCQSSDNPTRDVPDMAKPPVVRESELRAYCPGVSLREGTSYFSTYAKGGDGDATKVIYQASLSDTTRACTYEGDNVTIKVAAAGKVVPGPAVRPGTITMPIRVAVVRGSEVLYSKLHQQQVPVSDTTAATQFMFTDADITIPMPPQRNVSIFIGFDEGAKK
ncbi:hypothetical protein GCM10016234_02880 [Tianweitania populi]|uniref:Lipoprotein n=1 Tax=Tianweitania populi TaxID=1607949 RepID=A0A8J3DU64_9HYPH|nr:hypothetical protein [Tianweitania populi]GHD06017.1 hypothetical protein GCM10016234_02880 [Tianweitania populi]